MQAKLERWQIAAGELRQKLTIQTKTVVNNAKTTRGATVRDWGRSDVAEVWAHVEQLQDRKLELARQLVPTSTHKVVLRYNPDRILSLTETRFIYQSTVLYLHNITDVEERHVRLEVLCTEQVGVKP